MGLSSDLISQFVKSNKETKTNNKNGTLIQGTAKVKSSGDIFVVMDGSTIETPATTTTSVKDGERVLVTIKNHSAIITGNITSPSSSVLRLVDEFGNEINRITIDTLNADVANVKERLNANEINVNNLKANSVTTKELTTNYLKADDIESKYATIESLNASAGKIYKLESAYGDIDQLIFTNASGEIIQTGFSNAIIAQLGDAQIKSAMIESVSAGKITAGDIITNNVRVMSEDGSLIISDETLQISDGTRVRVQIGKDAANDYSINIWDQNGNLMFSKGGITDAAIKEAIIRNDMVSDTANIAAHKLDIDSLFEEINDSSNTIKSTKVYLDEEKQTLDVAFKSLTTEVTEQGETISSQGTAISTIQGQISSKIWQQDIDTATDEMSTKYSTLEQEVDGFKTAVSETYATVSDLDNLEIGGRNLIRDSRLEGYNVQELWNGGPVTKVDGWMEFKRDTVGSSRAFFTQYSANNPLLSDVEIGAAYTISIDLKTIDGLDIPPQTSVVWRLNYADTGFLDVAINVDPTKVTGEWQRFHTTVVLQPQSGKNFSDSAHVTVALGTAIGGIAFRRMKLEKGTRPTDWTPSPEDIETAITSNTTLIEQTATDLTARIESSAKTATNYLNFSSSGLVIGDMTASTLGKNVLIDSDSVDIRNGDTTLASFGADYLYLAKNSRNAKIDLCNGLATLYHESKYSYDTIFIIDTGNTTEIMGLINPLCVTSVDDLDEVSIQFANANGVMGGIGIVGSWLRRYGSNMYDKYTILDSGNYHDVMDSGWFYGGSIGENFSIYNDNTQIQYRKIGKVVHIRGAVKPTTTITGSSTSHLLFTLPEGYRPSVPVYARCQGSSAYTWLLSITAAGLVQFSRYGNGSTYADATAGTWLPFDVTFFID